MSTTIAEALIAGRKQLAAVKIETAALDARLLLQAALNATHEQLVADSNRALTIEDLERYNALILRRLRFEPVAKITGVKEFYGRAFRVTGDVLDPRPDTETVIALALRLMPGGRGFRALDLGSGSGAIICTVLAEFPLASGVAVDVSEMARAHTLQNAQAIGVADRLTVVDGPWFDKVDGQFDLILSNPPYIPHRDIAALAPDVRMHDPHLALDGGPDGLACYRSIAAGVAKHLSPGGQMILEIGAGQLPKVRAIFIAAGLTYLDQCLDLSGQVRAVAFTIVSP